MYRASFGCRGFLSSLSTWIGLSSYLQLPAQAFVSRHPNLRPSSLRVPLQQLPISSRSFQSSSLLAMAPNKKTHGDTSEPMRRKTPTKKKAKDMSDDESSASSSKTPSPRKKKASKKAAASPKKTAAKKRTKSDDGSPPSSPAKRKKAKSPAHQVLTDRDEIPKLWTPEQAAASGNSYTMKIASWNVAGLRALMRKSPDAIANLVTDNDIDVLCLQEHKLQESHLDDPKLKIRGHLLEAEGYDGYYTCSTAKKGYSGTAVFVKRRKGSAAAGSGGVKTQTTMDSFVKTAKKKAGTKNTVTRSLAIAAELLMPEKVTYKLGVDKHDQEGRIVSLDFPTFSMVNCYIPNAGQKLERLEYRTQEWDKDFVAFIQQKQKDRGVPVLWLGDLNVAHTNLEVWNDGAKHLAKQAGVTAEERASFQSQLDLGFVDAFRYLHPAAKGHYSYWSQRAGNRQPNKGLRLDYFICNQRMCDDKKSKVVVRDSYILNEVEGSDHCPVVLELEIKGS